MSNVANSGDARIFSEVVDPPVVVDRKAISGPQFMIDIGLLVAWICLTDWLLYQIGTFLAWGIMLMAAVCFLAGLRLRRTNYRCSTWIALAMVLVGAKLMWGGSQLLIGCGLSLLICFGMALSGLAPFFPEAIGFIGFMCFGATGRIRSYRITSPEGKSVAIRPGLSVVLPIAVVVCFSTLFILANPDIATRVARGFTSAFDWLGQMFAGFHVFEGIVWLVSGWVLLGLLYPAQAFLYAESKPVEFEQVSRSSPQYLAFRNTLVSVIVLFAAYLVFEFATLWFRDFPENFYYAGYAHQGALWLRNQPRGR